MSFDALANTVKTIPLFTGWQTTGHEASTAWFEVALEIDGIVEPSVTLHGEARADMPDMSVGFEIYFRYPNSKRKVALARLDWKSWKGGHTNKRKRGWPEPERRRVGETHFHAFELNWHPEKKKLRRGDLPVAAEIDGELQSFESARAMAGFLLRISNIDLVTRPPWRYIESQDGLYTDL